ncbi:MAG TPA: FtsX-like permease family protein [Nocardioidaceae bacterium]
MVTPGTRLIALRRSSVDAGSVVAVLTTVLVVCALVTGVVASLPSLQQEALGSALRQLPADDTVVEATSSYRADRAAAQDEAVRAALQPVVAVAGGALVRQAQTVAHEAAGGATWPFAAITADGGADGEVISAVEGRLPEGAVDGRPADGEPVEVAVPAGDDAAPPVGSRLVLTSPLDGSRVRAEVVGVWRPASEGVSAVGSSGQASLLVAEDSFAALAPRAASVRWRAAPDLDALQPHDLDRLRAAAAGADHAVETAGESTGAAVRVQNPLVAIAEARERELLAQRTLLLVPALLLLMLGAAAAVLVATALAETRRRDDALLRSRGADRRHVVGPTALEATLVCVLGAVLGPVLAAGVVRIGGTAPELGPSAWVAGAVAAAVCWVALVVPVAVRAFSGDRGEQLSVERRRRRTLTTLIAVTLLMVALGVVALVRLEGFAATVAAAGGGAEVDPLLVAAPALLLLSVVTVLALVLLPLLFALTERSLRTRGVALAVGTRAVSRAPSRAVPLALAVALVAGAIVFATVERASQQEAREARASYDVGADVRVAAPVRAVRAGGQAEREALVGLPGVEGVSGVRRSLDFIDDVAAEVVVAELDDEAGRALVAGADDPEGTAAALTSTGTPAVPVAVTADLVDDAALEQGSELELTIGDARVALRVAAVLPWVPTLDEGRGGVLVDAAALRAQAPRALGDDPDEWWLTVRAADVETVAQELRQRGDLAGAVLTRDQALRRLAADPGTGGAALADVMTVTALGALVIGGVLLGSVVVLRRRDREQQIGFLRALGAPRHDLTLTTATEYTVTTGGGVLAGAVAGMVTAAVALRATALGSGGQPLVPAPALEVPWSWMLLLLSLLLVVPLAALLAVSGPAGRMVGAATEGRGIR